MKMLKTEKNNWLKWTIIMLICYLLASYGVNGIVNPAAYFKQAMQEEVNIIYEEDVVFIKLPEDKGKYNYLNIELQDINMFETAVEVVFEYPGTKKLQKELVLCNRKNSFALQELGEDMIGISFEKTDLDKYDIILKKALLSEEKQPDTLKMLEIWISFLGITGVYVFMQWIKKRYAK